MGAKRIFKRILVEYFRFILDTEGYCGNECCFAIPRGVLWLHPTVCENYLEPSDLSRIRSTYFTRIDPTIQHCIIQRFPKLAPYFNEKLWFRTESDISVLSSVFAPIPAKTTPRYRKGIRIHAQKNSSISTSGASSPAGSRSSSPIPFLTTTKNTKQLHRSDSVHSMGSEASLSDNSPPKRYSLRPKRKLSISSVESEALAQASPPPKPKTRKRKPSGPPKRKYRKKLKLNAYLNALPDHVPPLKPYESNLVLKSKEGRTLQDLNLPLSVCGHLRRQCTSLDPVTKRYAVRKEDGSEDRSYNIELHY